MKCSFKTVVIIEAMVKIKLHDSGKTSPRIDVLSGRIQAAIDVHACKQVREWNFEKSKSIKKKRGNVRTKTLEHLETRILDN